MGIHVLILFCLVKIPRISNSRKQNNKLFKIQTLDRQNFKLTNSQKDKLLKIQTPEWQTPKRQTLKKHTSEVEES